jgi:hypothetical protein
LRRHQPEQEAEEFFQIYSDRDAFRFFGRETWPGDKYTNAFVKVLDSRIKEFIWKQYSNTRQEQDL